MQHFCTVVAVVPAGEVRGSGQGARGRAACAWVQLLGTVCRDVVLPVGTGQVIAGDLQWTEGHRGKAEAPGNWPRAEQEHVGVRQSEAALGIVSSGIWSTIGALSSGGAGKEEVPVQKQAGESGFDHYRSE